MSVIDTLITDRSHADYQLWEQLCQIPWSDMTAAQQQAWLAGAATKGSYNAADLNRVGQAMQYVADRLLLLGVSVSITPNTSFEEGSNKYPTKAQIEHYLEDLHTLENVYQATDLIPDSVDDWTVQIANDIERMLVLLDQLITSVLDCFIRSGMLTAFSGTSYYLKT